jgi:hypothetical protein
MISLNVSGSRSGTDLPHALTRLTCSRDASRSGMMETRTCCWVDLRKTICVAKRVQRPASRGSGFWINPSSTLLFPEDWSPTTTICGRSTSSPTPQAKSLSIFSSITGSARPCGSELRGAMVMGAVFCARFGGPGIVEGMVVEAAETYTWLRDMSSDRLQQTVVQTRADCRLRHKAAGPDRGKCIVNNLTSLLVEGRQRVFVRLTPIAYLGAVCAMLQVTTLPWDGLCLTCAGSRSEVKSWSEGLRPRLLCSL